MLTKDKIKSCMIGESVFKVGDYASLAQGWSIYRNVLSLEECINFKIIDLFCINDEESTLPKFIALVKTNKGNKVEINVEDLNDVRNNKENRQELNKVGYSFEDGAIYSKGYENISGIWKFINVGMDKLSAYGA
ncbi:hypothetical protein CLLI_17290 [Clostridium liquoris]|uniref:Uncharacterized protein n=1 Tax=Clostridium liquoris TaxID=1289519 RepID=A0A2T0B356_9CLOT|nr:hypothetical protein [Clostridium liquoris]PRR78302.1 hypothetical protein CLLI_17290 [Clostridium liquoris]